MYAKIKNGVVLKYPYTFNDLKAENPHTQLDGGDLPTLFSDTEEGLGGAELVSVQVLAKPAFNEITQFVSFDKTNVTKVGNVWQQSWTLGVHDSATAQQRLVAKRLELTEKIKQIRDSRVMTGGFKVNVGGIDRWVHSDTFSRTQWGMLARKADKIEMMGGDMNQVMDKPDGSGPLIWKMMGNSGFLPITPAIVLQIVASGEVQDTKAFYHCEVLIATINQHPFPHTVDLNQGWPPIYGE